MYFYTFQKVLGFGVQNLNNLHKWLWIKSYGCCDHLETFGRISGQKLIKFEPDSVCPSFSNTLYLTLHCNKQSSGKKTSYQIEQYNKIVSS